MMIGDMAEFGKKLRRLRDNRTQAYMAEQLDISTGYYGELERGVKQPTFTVITRIIAFSNHDANYWFGIEANDNQVKQDDITKLFSILHDMSKVDKRLDQYLINTINKNTTVAQLIVVIAQIRAYLSELDPDMLPESDRRTISDLLAACQRAMDGNEQPNPREEKHLMKVIND